jgi:predicted  nucleic acid-binding Zn-ribbon protein
MKSTFFSLAIVLLIITSCGKQSADYKALKAQNDSLLNAKLSLQREVDGYFSAMNEIEQNIEKIKSTENLISIQPIGQELNDDQRTKINEDMLYLSEMLQANKEELARLKSKLKKSGFKSSELQRTISRLTKALDEESLKVTTLNTKLAEKDSLIVQLGTTVSDLSKDIEEISTVVKVKETKIKELDETIHTAWYVFGTRKELKEQKIITSDGLFSPQRVLERDFNKNYFVRIDARNTKSIPLYSTRAKILTNHPKSSYTLEKENGNFVLLIVDQSEFWSISKYLVIEVE